ncbi:thioester domain-containing protein [Streptomyces sp. TRM 70351]|uniref:thioester domain-containing protein n=1 Tax=Streptomyces sp. TRM 70351 TaxID=3116552 RepID=UPI002E7BAFAE|nr:thioester domain-containing protein [Streptomyces sp. TRM 70351]MEE1928344.1 thioester domain-containing protein [Streptomyces sp. TRM 70351]
MKAIRGRAAARRAVTATAAGALAAVAAVTGTPTAAAGEAGPVSVQHGGAAATLGGLKVSGEAVIEENGTRTRTAAGLFEMSVAGGGSLLTYGIDMFSSTQQEAGYREVPWKATSLQGNENAGKIRWILEHSYPQVDDLARLAEQAGARELTPQTAAAGTQVAIWRYSEAAAGGGERPEITAADPAAEKLADHLEARARLLAEPRGALSLTSPAVAGRPGERLGPVTVRTRAQSVSVTPGPDATRLGVRLVDDEGEEVTAARNGTEVWFEVPADAEDAGAHLTVQATTPVPVGRVLAGTGAHTGSQAQIVAGSSDAALTATATANWAVRGAVPAVSAQRDCAAGGVAVTVTNRGDVPFPLALGEAEHEIPAGETGTHTVPVGEDQPYGITVPVPGGFEQTFSGVLDCATQGAEPVGTGLSVQSTPVTVGGSGGEQEAGVNLAETGAGTDVPLLVAVAAGLLVLGGGAVLVVRRGQSRPGAGDDA